MAITNKDCIFLEDCCDVFSNSFYNTNCQSQDNFVTTISQLIFTDSNSLTVLSQLSVKHKTLHLCDHAMRESSCRPNVRCKFQVSRSPRGDDEETKKEDNQVCGTRETRSHSITSRACRSSKQEDLS